MYTTLHSHFNIAVTLGTSSNFDDDDNNNVKKQLLL